MDNAQDMWTKLRTCVLRTYAMACILGAQIELISHHGCTGLWYPHMTGITVWSSLPLAMHVIHACCMLFMHGSPRSGAFSAPSGELEGATSADSRKALLWAAASAAAS